MPFDRIFALGKISSILKSYEENNLNNMDKKLVKGFFSRNLNDYKYLRRQKAPVASSSVAKESSVKGSLTKQ